MKRVLIREDDVSYFTPPEVLERLYGRLLRRSVPVDLGVIPRVSCSARLAFGVANPYYDGRLKYEPFIPPQFRGLPRTFEVGENRALVEYLRANPLLAVTQHGVAHDQEDLAFLSGARPDVFRQALLEGKAVLRGAFDQTPLFFTPPWGRLSPKAMEVLRGEFLGVSTIFTRRRFLPLPLWGRYLVQGLRHRGLLRWEGCLVVTHPFDLLRFRFPDPDDLVRQVARALEEWDLLVINNHHWEFLIDWSGWDEARLRGWDAVVDHLLRQTDLQFETFRSLEAATRSNGAVGPDQMPARMEHR